MKRFMTCIIRIMNFFTNELEKRFLSLGSVCIQNSTTFTVEVSNWNYTAVLVAEILK